MEIDKELKKIKDVVRSLLESNEKTRNSDKHLIIETLRALGFKIYIDYKDLEAMPSWESIRRTRQKLQEENMNLRGDEEIQEQRDKKREVFKEVFKKSIEREIAEPNFLRPRATIEVTNFIPSRIKGTEVFEK